MQVEIICKKYGNAKPIIILINQSDGNRAFTQVRQNEPMYEYLKQQLEKENPVEYITYFGK